VTRNIFCLLDHAYTQEAIKIIKETKVEREKIKEG
jgi:hypothetical protein